jgi:outer membrane beta-barrel protein
MAADQDTSTSPSDQEQIIKPELDRREIVVPAIDTEDFEVGVYTGVMSVEDFGANTVSGLRFAYHVTESAFFEVAYGTTDTEKTSYERLSGATQLLTADERKLTYYNVSIGYNLLPGESFIGTGRAFNSALYVIAGVGSTEFGGDNRFTTNFGAGYRLLDTDWLAFHADVRDHIFKNDLLGTEKTSHNIEIHGGITFFF